MGWLCVQRAIAIYTLADVVSTWSCTSCLEARAAACVSGVDTIPKDGTVSTANQASTETALGTRHTARCAEVLQVFNVMLIYAKPLSGCKLYTITRSHAVKDKYRI